MAPETQQAHLQPLWLVPQGERTVWPHLSDWFFTNASYGVPVALLMRSSPCPRSEGLHGDWTSENWVTRSSSWLVPLHKGKSVWVTEVLADLGPHGLGRVSLRLGRLTGQWHGACRRQTLRPPSCSESWWAIPPDPDLGVWGHGCQVSGWCVAAVFF